MGPRGIPAAPSSVLLPHPNLGSQHFPSCLTTCSPPSAAWPSLLLPWPGATLPVPPCASHCPGVPSPEWWRALAHTCLHGPGNMGAWPPRLLAFNCQVSFPHRPGFCLSGDSYGLISPLHGVSQPRTPTCQAEKSGTWGLRPVWSISHAVPPGSNLCPQPSGYRRPCIVIL